MLSLLLHALLLFFIRFEQPDWNGYSSGTLPLNVVLNTAPGEAAVKPTAIAAATQEGTGAAKVGVERKNPFIQKPVTATTNTPVADFKASVPKKQPDKDILTVPKSAPGNVVETAPDVLVTQATPEPEVEKPYAPAPSVEKAPAPAPPQPEKIVSSTPVEGPKQDKIVFAEPVAEKPAEKVKTPEPAPAPVKPPEPVPVPAAAPIKVEEPRKIEAPAPVVVPSPVKVVPPPVKVVPPPVKVVSPPVVAPPVVAPPVVAPPPAKVEPPPVVAPPPIKIAEAAKAPAPPRAAAPQSTPAPQAVAAQPRPNSDVFSAAPSYKVPSFSDLNLSSIGKVPAEKDYKIKFGERRKTVGIKEQDLKYALYVESVRLKLERIGQFNYPAQAARNHLSGALAVIIAIRADGTLESFSLIQPAAYEVFNSAAERIVRMAAPFSPLPEKIRQETDVLSIRINWSFSQSEQSLD